jgi:diamine N-acetyltransferase
VTRGRRAAGQREGTITVRVAASTDAAALAAFGARTFREAFARFNAPGDMAAYLEVAFGVARQSEELADEAGTFLVAEDEDTLVGYAHLRRGSAPRAVPGRAQVELVRIYAESTLIGRGIGAALIRASLERAALLGCDVIWLGVWERNPRAIAFYERWGFETVGTKEFRLGDDIQHDLVMCRVVGEARCPTAEGATDVQEKGGLTRQSLSSRAPGPSTTS